MASRFPTYQRQNRLSADIVTPPNTDQAALRESQKSAQQLARNAEQVQQFALKNMQQTAIQEGTQAGLDDPIGTLAGKGGKRPTFSQYEMSAFDAAVKVAAVDIETNARIQMKEAWLAFQKSKGDPQELRDELSTIQKGYSDSISNLDPLTAAQLDRKLTSANQSLFLDFSTDHLKREEKRLAGQAESLFQGVKLSSGLLGRQKGDDKTLTKIITDFTQSMEEIGHAGTPTFASDISKIKKEYHTARVRAEFQRAMDVGKGSEYIEKFQKDLAFGKGSARGLDETDKKTRSKEMLSNFRSDLAARDRASRVKKAELNKEIRNVSVNITEVIKTLNDGYVVSSARLNDMVKQAQVTGDDELIKRAIAVEEMYEFAREHEHLNSDDLRDRIKTLKLGMTKDDNIDSNERIILNYLNGVATKLEKKEIKAAKTEQGLDKALAQENKREALLRNRKIKDLSRDIKSETNRLKTGISVSPDVIRKFAERANALGVTPELQNQIGNISTLVNIYQQFRTANPTQLLQAKNNLRKIFLQDNDLSVPEQNRIKVLESLITQREQLQGKTVELYNQINPTNNLTPLDLSDPNSIKERVQTLNDFSVAYEFKNANQFLSENEAENLSNIFESPNAAEQIVLLESISKGFGRHSINVYKQLDSKNPILANAGALLNLNNDREIVTLALKGFEVSKSVPGGTSKIVNSRDENLLINQAINELLPNFNIADKKRTNDFLRNVVIGKKATNSNFIIEEFSDLTPLLQRSIGAIYQNNEHIRGGVVEFNNKTVYVTPNIYVDEDHPNSLQKLIYGNLADINVSQAMRSTRLSNVRYPDKLTSSDFSFLGITKLQMANGTTIAVDEQFFDYLNLETLDGQSVRIKLNNQPVLDQNNQPASFKLDALLDLRASYFMGAF